MKKIKQRLQNLNLGEDRILNRKELKKILGGNGISCDFDDECPNGLICIDNVCVEEGACIENGQPCEWFRRCCNECKSNFKCGPKTP